MMRNVRRYERVFRTVVGVVLVLSGIGFGGLTEVLLILAGLYLVSTGGAGYCLLYHAAGINREYADKKRFLGELPRFNDEPVFVFGKNRKMLFQNEAAKKILPSIASLEDITVENAASLFDPEAKHSDMTHREAEKSYLLHPKLDTKNDLLYLYGFNITELEEKRESLHVQMITDSLTALGNRNRLQQEQEELSALLLLDIHRFGEINSFYGNTKGDTFLIRFGELLQTYMSGFGLKNMIYRIGGDVFAVGVVHGGNDKEAFKTAIKKLAYSLYDYFARTEINVGRLEVTVDVAIGYSLAGGSHQLFLEAQTALLEAKRQGVRFLGYSEVAAVEKQYEENIYWSKKLKKIFSMTDEAEIVPYYQPIINIRTNKIDKFESLARVVEGDEVIPPFKFVNAAKKGGMIPLLTEQMINKSFERFSKEKFSFSINVTVEDFEENLLSTLNRLCDRYGIERSRVVLEILEDEAMYEYADFLCGVKEEGYRLAIDDFGVGYSNFGKLQHIRADFIKIDGSLVKNIDQNPHDAALIKSLVEYAKSLGAETVAEFVHSKEVFEKVRELGVDYAQGYYIGVPAAEPESTFGA